MYIKGQRHAELEKTRKWKGSVEWPQGVRKQDSSTLTAKVALLPSSYRMERGSSPPGKDINQDLREPKPDKTKALKSKLSTANPKKCHRMKATRNIAMKTIKMCSKMSEQTWKETQKRILQKGFDLSIKGSGLARAFAERERVRRLSQGLHSGWGLPESWPASDSIPMRSSSEWRTNSAKGSCALAEDWENRGFWAY